MRERGTATGSCFNLETDCITWYQLHATDPKVHFTESVGALARLQEEGKIQHVGLSNVGVVEIQAAREIVNVVSVQNRCNPFDRDSFNSGVVAFCTRENIAFYPTALWAVTRDIYALRRILHCVL